MATVARKYRIGLEQKPNWRNLDASRPRQRRPQTPDRSWYPLRRFGVVSATISPPRITGASAIPSSYSPSWDGAKGAFLLLQNLGYNVSRWEQPPTQLPQAANEVLILAE